MSTTEDAVAEGVINIVRSITGVDSIILTDNLHDSGADSLDIIEITMAVEGAFEVEIANEVAEDFYTVYDIVSYLRRLGIKAPVPKPVVKPERVLSSEERLTQQIAETVERRLVQSFGGTPGQDTLETCARRIVEQAVDSAKFGE